MDITKYFKDAEFISASDNNYSPYIRKSFYINEKIKKARLYLCALGFCEIYINNNKVSDKLYITPLSEYNKQTLVDNPSLDGEGYFNDNLSYTAYVSEFDVTSFIKKGKNAFGMILAGGWYRSELDKHNNFRNFGIIKVCFRIEMECESGKIIQIKSDNSAKWKESFLLRSGIFHEEQDERKEILNFSDAEFDDSEWNDVEIQPVPETKFMQTDCPPNKIISYIAPKLIYEDKSKKIYDVGENITGYPVIVGKSCSGDEIKCVCSEVLNEDKTLDEFHSYSQNFSIISDGRDEHFIRFTWHGFRYFSLFTTGKIEDVSVKKCAIVHADIKNTSEFNCDNNIINFIYDAYVRTQLENFQCGVPTDCPQIERKGYTGDGQLLCNLGMTLFDSQKLYKKWIHDISDVQDRNTGYVHNTAPCFIGCNGGVGGWSVAIINVPYEYYKIYGDKEILTKYYDQMKHFVSFMENETVDGVISVKDRTGCALGDWSGPSKPYISSGFVNTCMFVSALMKLMEISEVTGNERDCAGFAKLISGYKRAINNNYYDEFTGNYLENIQGANAFALNIGLGDERTIRNLVNYYENSGGYDTGIFGTDILTKVLFEYGYEKTAIKLLTSKNDVSYYTWMKDGATTLYESWLNTRSLNHPMFGSVVRYFIEYILGIRQNSGVGYEDVIINPACTDIIRKAQGKITTVKGEISVLYTNTNGVLNINIDIPEKVTAILKLKDKEIKLGNGTNKFTI